MEKELKYIEYSYEEISKEEFQIRIGEFYKKLDWLNENLEHLCFEAYRKQFSHIFRTMNLGQYQVLPNTSRIEERAIEVYGKEVVDKDFERRFKVE